MEKLLFDRRMVILRGFALTELRLGGDSNPGPLTSLGKYSKAVGP